MPNTSAPFGFRHVGYLPGYAPDMQLKTQVIAAANATKIFFGDPVVLLSTGYIAQGVNGATLGPIGIFQGCEFLDAAGKYTFSPYWPGAAQADAIAHVIAAPGALFEVQALLGPITFADIGQNADFTIGTGSVVGPANSGASLSNLGTTATLPFKIVGLGGGNLNAGGLGEQGNGADNTTAYNIVQVTFNQQDYKAGTGGV